MYLKPVDVVYFVVTGVQVLKGILETEINMSICKLHKTGPDGPTM
jgi:hypothetical protein